LLAKYDSQLFFNNGKDVSSGETNVLTGVNWKALPAALGVDGISNISEDGATDFYLYNGTTVKDVQKSSFCRCLRHSTIPKIPFCLEVDTVNYEPEIEDNGGGMEVKPIPSANYNAVEPDLIVFLPPIFREVLYCQTL
jgi:hypothetical protein